MILSDWFILNIIGYVAAGGFLYIVISSIFNYSSIFEFGLLLAVGDILIISGFLAANVLLKPTFMGGLIALGISVAILYLTMYLSFHDFDFDFLSIPYEHCIRGVIRLYRNFVQGIRKCIKELRYKHAEKRER